MKIGMKLTSDERLEVHFLSSQLIFVLNYSMYALISLHHIQTFPMGIF